MRRVEMLALAERVEQASGPDRALDAVILMTAAPPAGAERLGHWMPLGTGQVYAWTTPPPHASGTGGVWADAPRYTASLDAATTLMPDAHCWSILVGRLAIQAGYWRRAEDESAATAWVVAATPALALCAAALRARAEEARDDR
jgi:hypothetical protein